MLCFPTNTTSAIQKNWICPPFFSLGVDWPRCRVIQEPGWLAIAGDIGRPGTPGTVDLWWYRHQLVGIWPWRFFSFHQRTPKEDDFFWWCGTWKWDGYTMLCPGMACLFLGKYLDDGEFQLSYFQRSPCNWIIISLNHVVYGIPMYTSQRTITYHYNTRGLHQWMEGTGYRTRFLF